MPRPWFRVTSASCCGVPCIVDTKGIKDMAEPLYPPIDPYDRGMLDVGDGNRVYWEVCGNPDGKPALFVHGGPGWGCQPGRRQYFDPDRYRAVLFDQRGCGRSTPHASDPATDMGHNTTEHLLADMERLRGHLGIQRWPLCGGSWGSTLLLAYAERHPHQVSEIVIAGVTTSRRSEIDWLYRGARRFLPEQWERFQAGVPAADRDGDLLGAYARLLEDPDPDVRAQAANSWCAWEDALLSQEPGGDGERLPEPRTGRQAGAGSHLRALLRPPGMVGRWCAAARCRTLGRDPSCADPRSPGPGQPAGHRVGTGPRLAGCGTGRHRRLRTQRQRHHARADPQRA
jgi:proline iminopeptidase